MGIRLKYVYKKKLILPLLSICLIIGIVSMRTPQEWVLFTESVELQLRFSDIINMTENVTKPLFSLIKPANNLTFVSDMVQEKHPTFYPVGYSIIGESICSQGSFSILILIPSTSNHQQRRDAIRQTWASMVYQDLGNGYQTQNVRLAFFFGDGLLDDTEKKKLQEEANFFSDIVIGNFHDTYRNLSLKMGHAISWADLYCRQAPFIVKVDDDVFLNIDLLMNVLTQLPDTASDFNLGFRNIHVKPPVIREGRWGNDVSSYPFEHYPPYVVGYAYVLSRSAVQKVAKNLPFFRIIANEDAFINGIVAKSLNITRIHSNAFSSPIKRYTYCDVAFNRYLSFLVDSKKLPSVWESFRSKICSSKSFI